MLEKYKAANRKKHSTTLIPNLGKTSVEDEQNQLSVVEQFKKIQQEQNQTLLQKLQQKYK